MAFQSPRLNLIRSEGAMVPAKHLLRPVCSRFTRPYREALPAYWPPPNNSTGMKSWEASPTAARLLGLRCYLNLAANQALKAQWHIPATSLFGVYSLAM